MTKFMTFFFNQQIFLTQIEHLEFHAKEKPQSTLWKHQELSVFSLNQYLKANGLLPFEAPKIPGVPKGLIIESMCQVSEKVKAEEGDKHLKSFTPKLGGTFLHRERKSV